MSKTTFKVKNFIKAKSPTRLRSLMYQKQLELSMAALHFDIVSHKGELIAFYDEILTNDKVKQMDNDVVRQENN